MTATLITGASSGIGAALAEVAADRGHDLVLVARRADRLQTLADRLRAAHGVRTLVVAADLSAEDSAVRVHDEVVGAGWSVDVLVNNAGFACDGHFLDVPWRDHRTQLRVLLETPAQLAHCFLPAMLGRGRGHVVNVSSVAGLVAGSPMETLYGPAKRAMVTFTRNLAEEYRGRGVGFTAVCPGVTATELTEDGYGLELVRLTPGFLVATPRSVAEETWRGVDAGRTIVVPGRANRVATAALRALPSPMSMRVLAMSSRRLDRGAQRALSGTGA